MSLPVAVTLKRFFAPLCVFSFCSVTALTALPLLHRLLLAKRVHEHNHRSAFEPRRRFDRPVRPQLIGELIQQAPADIRMRHLAPAEKHGQFHFVAGIEKLRGLAALCLEIMIVDLRPNPHFFQLDDVLIATRLSLFPALLISELAVVHEPGHGRNRIWGNLDKVEPPLASHLERISSLDDPYLFAGFVNEANLPNSDPLVDARLYWSGYSLPP